MNSNDINQLILSLGDPINLLIGLTGLIAILTAWSVNKALNSMKVKMGIKPKERKGWSFKSLNQSMWDDVPMEAERDVLLDHNYDGIQELDNNLPPWWIWGFYMSIAWSVIYFGYYHFTENAQPHAKPQGLTTWPMLVSWLMNPQLFNCLMRHHWPLEKLSTMSTAWLVMLLTEVDLLGQTSLMSTPFMGGVSVTFLLS